MIDLDDIDTMALEAIEQNRGKVARESLVKIDPRIHTYYNSINVLCGRQGLGKTFTAVKEIAKITTANKRTCLVVYVTKEGNKCDDTMESLKHLIRVPVQYVSEENAEKYVQMLQDAMDFYKDVKDSFDEDELNEEDVRNLFRALHIHDFEQPSLHIVIMFDDFANSKLVKKPDSFFSKFIATLRHRGFSVFICVQFWKSIPTQIKANITTIYIFGSYSKQQFRYMLDQIPLEQSWQQIYRSYQDMSENDKLVVDAISSKVVIDSS
jgi:hypothetical protein